MNRYSEVPQWSDVMCDVFHKYNKITVFIQQFLCRCFNILIVHFND